jgi:hypothetical protein
MAARSGSRSATISSKQNIHLLGEGSGGTGAVLGVFDATRAAVRLVYTGVGQLATAIEARGPIAIGIENIQIDCTNATVDVGLWARHVFRSHFKNFNICFFDDIGVDHDPYKALPAGCFIGACDNVWENCHFVSQGFGTCTGIDIGFSTAGAGFDVARDTFIGCTFSVEDDATATAIQLRGCDNLTFVNCFTFSPGQRRAIGVRVIAPTTSLPSEVTFINCPLVGGVTTPTDGSWDPAINGGHGLNFFPLNTGDMEAPGFTGTKLMPVNAVVGSVRGFASDGRQVGGATRPEVTGAAYTIKQFDNNSLIPLNRSSAIAVTLPNASDLGFRAGWWTELQNRGTGAAVITPTGCTIDGQVALVLLQNEGFSIFSDGTNYFTSRGRGIGGLLGSSGVAVSHTGNVNETVLVTVPIPGRAMGPNGWIRIFSNWTYTNNANNKLMKVRLNGIAGTIYADVTMTATDATRIFVDIQNRNANNSQVGSFGQTTGIQTSAIDTTVNVDLVFTAQLANAADTITLQRFSVELWHKP